MPSTQSWYVLHFFLSCRIFSANSCNYILHTTICKTRRICSLQDSPTKPQGRTHCAFRYPKISAMLSSAAPEFYLQSTTTCLAIIRKIIIFFFMSSPKSMFFKKTSEQSLDFQRVHWVDLTTKGKLHSHLSDSSLSDIKLFCATFDHLYLWPNSSCLLFCLFWYTIYF